MNEWEILDLLWLFSNRLRTNIGEVILAAAVEAASPISWGVKARRSI